MDWRVLALVTVLSWGGYAILLKAIADRLPWQLSMLWFVVGYTIFILAFCMINMIGGRMRIVHPAMGWALLAGALCGVGAIAFFKAMPMAAGSVFLPITGLYVVVTALGCLVFLHEPFSLRVLAGILCAGAAVVLLGK